MNANRKLIHSTQIPIRWGDLDAFGHVNNTIYFRYAEQARVEWIDDLRLGARGMQGGPRDIMPVVVNASCTFLIPMNYPGTVELTMYADHPGRSSVMTHFEMRLVGDERLFAEGSAKMVWMSLATGKGATLPEAIRAIFDDGAGTSGGS